MENEIPLPFQVGIKCPSCKYHNNHGAVLCSNCGRSLEGVQPTGAQEGAEPAKTAIPRGCAISGGLFLALLALFGQYWMRTCTGRTCAGRTGGLFFPDTIVNFVFWSLVLYGLLRLGRGLRRFVATK